jgi:hypothetical protein
MRSARFTPPLLDGRPSPKDPEMVEAMARVLADHHAFVEEREAVRALSSRGFGYGAIVRLTDRARDRARQLAGAS